jgi:hypothetical protein
VCSGEAGEKQVVCREASGTSEDVDVDADEQYSLGPIIKFLLPGYVRRPPIVLRFA